MGHLLLKKTGVLRTYYSITPLEIRIKIFIKKDYFFQKEGLIFRIVEFEIRSKEEEEDRHQA